MEAPLLCGLVWFMFPSSKVLIGCSRSQTFITKLILYITRGKSMNLCKTEDFVRLNPSNMGVESESVWQSVMSNSCDPMDCSPPGSSVHEILQERILEWVSIPFSRGSSWPRIKPEFPVLAGRFFFNAEPPGKPLTLYYCSWNFE